MLMTPSSWFYLVILLWSMGVSAFVSSSFLHDKAMPEVLVFNAYEQEPKLTESALQKAELFIQGDETDIYVRLQNRAGAKVDSWIGQHPGREAATLSEAFYSQICHQEVLVLVIQKRVNTAITSGDSYFNALFDPGSGEWLATFHGAKVKDKETDEWFVDSQKPLLATLVTGKLTPFSGPDKQGCIVRAKPF